MENQILAHKKAKTSKLLALAAIGLAGTTALAGSMTLKSQSTHAEMSNAAITQAKPYANAPASFADLVEKVRPSVVSINVKGKPQKKRPNLGRRAPAPPFGNRAPDQNPFGDFFRRFGQPQPPQQAPKNAQGSGFIISEDGYVVTNHHVIADGEDIQVILDDGERLDARLVGSDERTDLALLKIKEKRKFPFVPMSNKIARVGDWVLAVGNPFGLASSVTAGIVSAHGRRVGASPYDYLQIDAAVNRGNSGGPAFNLNGEVVGVNSAIYSPSGGNVGIAFAIPSVLVSKIVADLKEGGSVQRGWLGINIQDVSEDIANGLSLEKAGGALVTRLVETGPAAKSDLKTRDVIVKVNGEDVDDVRDLMRKIGEINPGEIVDLEVVRDGQNRKVAIKLGTFPDGKQLAALQRKEPGLDQGNEALDELGISLASARNVGKGDEGVVITEIDPDSDAASKGIKVGDVILEVNGSKVNFPADVATKILEAKKLNKGAGNGKKIVMLVRMKDGPYVGLKLSQKED
ncbi:MAG: serine peptidase [Rhodomicrobium sp.]|nr:MAG: serine peptidase [Rhodomicrobium sp.]